MWDLPQIQSVLAHIRAFEDSAQAYKKSVEEEAVRTRRMQKRGSVTGMLAIQDVFCETMHLVEMERAAKLQDSEVKPVAASSEIVFPPGMFRLADLLQMMASHGKSGQIRVETEDEKILITMSHGEVTHAQSIDGPEENRLGSILVDLGVLTPDQLATVLAANRKSGQRVGRILVEGMGVAKERVREALHDQLKRLFHRALGAETAVIAFVEGEQEPSDGNGMSIMNIMLESLAESERPEKLA